MRFACSIYCALFTLTALSVCAQDSMDRVDEALTFSGFDDQVRARFSGLLDLEAYSFSGAPQGLIFTDQSSLLNPRLTLFFDAQIGSSLYLFVQSRVDRGFDPSDSPIGITLSEYALRWTPREDGLFNLQVGRFATIVGNYVGRHLSWDNPFINAPMIYGNVTAIYDSEAPPTVADFAAGIVDAKYEYNPVIWGPAYTSGLSVSGTFHKVDYAVEVKNAALSSRPENWDSTQTNFDHPTVSARLGFRPDMAWNLGLSASEGSYFSQHALSTLPAGTGLGDFKQQVLGQDISYAWRHWQIWAEVYEARFQVPLVGNADTVGYYLEAKYKFKHNLFGALRWNQQFFADIPNGVGGQQPWGHDLSRLDAALTYRFTPQTQLKLQYSVQHEAVIKSAFSHLLGVQFTVRF